jgi:hypothetical protein
MQADLSPEWAADPAAVRDWLRRAFAAAGRQARDHQVDAVARLVMAVQEDDDDGGNAADEGDDDGTAGADTAANGKSPQRPPSEAPAAPRPRRRARNFLLQHSAGSGKSLTIAALVHGLLAVPDGSSSGSGGSSGGGAFGVVLIVNDRLQLDAQLGDTVAAFLASELLDPTAERTPSWPIS